MNDTVTAEVARKLTTSSHLHKRKLGRDSIVESEPLLVPAQGSALEAAKPRGAGPPAEAPSATSPVYSWPQRLMLPAPAAGVSTRRRKATS